MTADNFSPLPPEEKPNAVALVLSATVHLLLIGALFFGVQWKSQAPSGVAIEVWRSTSGPVAVAKREPAPVPPPPQPEPKPEPKIEPKPEPKVEPAPPVKPDIAVKEEKKKEEPKKAEPKPEPKPEPKKEEPKKPEPKKEEPKKPEPKKEEPKKPEPKKEEPKKPEPKPEEPAWKKAMEREERQLDRHKAATQAAQSRNAALDAEFSQLGQMKGAQAAAARKAGEGKYIAALRGKIRGNIVLPPGIKGNPEAEFKITQLPTGEVIGVKISKSSGNRALDEAIERAIKKSDPLPLPDDPSLFQRELTLKYWPFDG